MNDAQPILVFLKHQETFFLDGVTLLPQLLNLLL